MQMGLHWTLRLGPKSHRKATAKLTQQYLLSLFLDNFNAKFESVFNWCMGRHHYWHIDDLLIHELQVEEKQ